MLIHSCPGVYTTLFWIAVRSSSTSWMIPTNSGTSLKLVPTCSLTWIENLTRFEWGRNVSEAAHHFYDWARP